MPGYTTQKVQYSKRRLTHKKPKTVSKDTQMEDKQRQDRTTRPLLPGPIPRTRDICVVHNLHNRIKQLQYLVDTLEHKREKQQKGDAADFERTRKNHTTMPDPSLLFMTQVALTPKKMWQVAGGEDTSSTDSERVPNTTGFDFLADLPTEGSGALTQEESRLLNRILEWDVRHGLETDWWVVKLYFPVNRRRVLDSVRAIVETAITERKENVTHRVSLLCHSPLA